MSSSLQPHGLSPPGSSLHGISEALISEWVAIHFSRGSSWPGIWILFPLSHWGSHWHYVSGNEVWLLVLVFLYVNTVSCLLLYGWFSWPDLFCWITISSLNRESCFHSEQKALLTFIIQGRRWLLAHVPCGSVFTILYFPSLFIISFTG